MARSDRRTCLRLESQEVCMERTEIQAEIKILRNEINAKFLIFDFKHKIIRLRERVA